MINKTDSLAQVKLLINMTLFFLTLAFFKCGFAVNPESLAVLNSDASETQSVTDTSDDLTYSDETTEINDPLEGFNRIMFEFNYRVDKVILKPIATLYNKIMPKPLNRGIHNAYNNFHTVTTVANDLLQLHFHQFANDVWRIGINTTLGVGGLFDVAERINLPYYRNDFGLTLARWGYKNSTYIVLPFWGPNTIRDGIGLPIDYYVFSLYPHIHPLITRYAVYFGSVVDARAHLLQFQAFLDEASLDDYVFIRNAYLQSRAQKIEDNINQTDRLDDEPVAVSSA